MKYFCVVIASFCFYWHCWAVEKYFKLVQDNDKDNAGDANSQWLSNQEKKTIALTLNIKKYITIQNGENEKTGLN